MSYYFYTHTLTTYIIHENIYFSFEHCSSHLSSGFFKHTHTLTRYLFFSLEQCILHVNGYFVRSMHNFFFFSLPPYLYRGWVDVCRADEKKSSSLPTFIG